MAFRCLISSLLPAALALDGALFMHFRRLIALTRPNVAVKRETPICSFGRLRFYFNDFVNDSEPPLIRACAERISIADAPALN